MMLRRSTIEVHPTFSEAPHLTSSIPHPKTEFSKSQNASRRIIPHGLSLQNAFFSKSRLGSRNPVFQKQNSGNVLPLSSNGSVVGIIFEGVPRYTSIQYGV